MKRQEGETGVYGWSVGKEAASATGKLLTTLPSTF